MGRRTGSNCEYFNQTPRLRPSTPPKQRQIPDSIPGRQPHDRHNRDDCRDRNDARSSESSIPEWLISIRDASEWTLAAASHAAIIDFKEPSLGPLAPTNPLFWHWAVQQPARGHHLSAALGESASARRLVKQLPAGFHFAKVGPSNCGSLRQLRRLWNDIRGSLACGVELVAVAYADAVAAQTLEVETILAAARDLGFRRCLIDTFAKDGRSSLQILGRERLADISQWARRQGIWWALAGSITLETAKSLAQCGIAPNCLGVRGALCDGSREGDLSVERLSQWQQWAKGCVPT